MILAAASVLAGTVLACFLAILPGLHIYNVMGLAALFLYSLHGGGLAAMPEVYIPFMLGLVTGWSILNTIPSVLLGAQLQGIAWNGASGLRLTFYFNVASLDKSVPLRKRQRRPVKDNPVFGTSGFDGELKGTVSLICQ